MSAVQENLSVSRKMLCAVRNFDTLTITRNAQESTGITSNAASHAKLRYIEIIRDAQHFYFFLFYVRKPLEGNSCTVAKTMPKNHTIVFHLPNFFEITLLDPSWIWIHNFKLSPISRSQLLSSPNFAGLSNNTIIPLQQCPDEEKEEVKMLCVA